MGNGIGGAGGVLVASAAGFPSAPKSGAGTVPPSSGVSGTTIAPSDFGSPGAGPAWEPVRAFPAQEAVEPTAASFPQHSLSSVLGERWGVTRFERLGSREHGDRLEQRLSLLRGEPPDPRSKQANRGFGFGCRSCRIGRRLLHLRLGCFGLRCWRSGLVRCGHRRVGAGFFSSGGNSAA